MNTPSKILIAMACGLVISSQAKAEGLTVGLHTISAHIPQHKQNNVNPGAYLRTAGGVELGFYRNTWRRPSLYVSQQFDLMAGSYGAFGAQIGLANGYQRRCATAADCSGFSRGAISPLAGLTYTPPMEVMGIKPRVQFLPPIGKHGAVIHLTLER